MALRVGQAAQSGLMKNEVLRVLGSEVQRTMIRFQIVEREGVDLYRTLLQAMREGLLRTLHAKNRGRKVVHARYPGWGGWPTGTLMTLPVLMFSFLRLGVVPGGAGERGGRTAKPQVR